MLSQYKDKHILADKCQPEHLQRPANYLPFHTNLVKPPSEHRLTLGSIDNQDIVFLKRG